MTGADLAILLFTATNSLRLFAYLPQIVSVGRDRHGASAISYTTWSLFAVSNSSTVAYALAVLDDRRMAIVFGANAACCVAIVAMTALKRLGHRRAGPSSARG